MWSSAELSCARDVVLCGTYRTHKFEGFARTLECMFPNDKYTGQAFLSPEKFVKCVLSESMIRGSTVAPPGSFICCLHHHLPLFNSSYWRVTPFSDAILSMAS